MGFHKRFIDDSQVIETFRSRGCQAVIDMYTKGADAIITSGKLSTKVDSLISDYNPNNVKSFNKISITIARASYKKRMSD